LKQLIFILLLLTLNVPNDYPLKYGKPTSKGIEMYVEDRRDSLLVEYQNFIQDTLFELFDVWIYAEDLTDYVDHDSMELGRYWPDEAIISKDPLFVAYELADLSKFKRTMYVETNAFVKSTIFHELTHHYIHVISREMEYEKIYVDRAYRTNIWIIRDYTMFGSIFIEEGICEYQTGAMGEIIVPKKPWIPKTQSELMDRNNKYNAVYKYSAHYLKIFLDTTGFKEGVRILLHNVPPSYAEILNPEVYFNRLEYEFNQ